jgi:hypothetical protein
MRNVRPSRFDNQERAEMDKALEPAAKKAEPVCMNESLLAAARTEI